MGEEGKNERRLLLILDGLLFNRVALEGEPVLAIPPVATPVTAPETGLNKAKAS